MSGPASPLSWFCFSLSLAPGLVRERLQGVLLPAVPEGELAEALDVELVYDVRAPDWDGRVARLVAAPGQRLAGRLRAVPPPFWPQVRALEEQLAQATHTHPVHVRTASGALVTAQAFTPPAPASPDRGPVSQDFLGALARAAAYARLPSPYVTRLQAEAQLVQAVQRAQTERLR
ncbi:gamma-glutamylcyclotransferase [Melittangium boletus]|uniref:gamma-glutamylcyclotransferase n=1 Tax=Melittangium boletus TaxID=83453 RepID=UPI003DA5CF8C